jgi:hypothetical protein
MDDIEVTAYIFQIIVAEIRTRGVAEYAGVTKQNTLDLFGRAAVICSDYLAFRAPPTSQNDRMTAGAASLVVANKLLDLIDINLFEIPRKARERIIQFEEDLLNTLGFNISATTPLSSILGTFETPFELFMGTCACRDLRMLQTVSVAELSAASIEAANGNFESPIARRLRSIHASLSPKDPVVLWFGRNVPKIRGDENHPLLDCKREKPRPYPRIEFENFDILRCLGKGAFGTVHLCRRPDTGEILAVKQSVFKDHEIHPDLVREAATLTALTSHLNIVELVSAVVELGELCLFYKPHGMSLWHILKRGEFPGDHKRTGQQILNGMAFIHGKGFAHCDFKCSNVLYENEVAKINDFGASKPITKGVPVDFMCTITYRPPEQLIEDTVRGTLASDAWACGVVLLELMSNVPDVFFTGKDEPPAADVLAQIHAKLGPQESPYGDLQVASEFGIGQSTAAAILRLLKFHPDDRAECCSVRLV